MNIFLIAVIAIIIVSYLLELVVEILNLGTVKGEIPDEMKEYYDEEKYRKSQLYLYQTTFFGLIKASLSVGLVIILIGTGAFGALDSFARDVAPAFGSDEIRYGLTYFAFLGVFSSLFNLPFAIISTFVIEERFGFNRTTLKTFVTDRFLAIVLTVVLGAPLLASVLWFFDTLGPSAWWVAWLAVTSFQIFLLFIAPVVLMPLFYKFTPLPDGPLKSAIAAYADSQNFHLSGLFTMDGSKRSSKANAFFTGFGRFRRVVLFDTLLEKHTNDELVAVLAHEIGHFKLGHILKNLAFGILSTGLSFWFLSLLIKNQDLFAAFKVENLSIYASLIFVSFLYTPFSRVIGVFSSWLSRRYEFQADAFSIQTYAKPEILATALKKLSVENLSHLTPHPLKVFLEYSHPPVLERARAMRAGTN